MGYRNRASNDHKTPQPRSEYRPAPTRHNSNRERSTKTSGSQFKPSPKVFYVIFLAIVALAGAALSH